MFSSAACCVLINHCCCCCITLRRILVDFVAKLVVIEPSFEVNGSSNSWACFVSRMRDQRIAYLVVFTVEEALGSLLKLLVLLYSIIVTTALVAIDFTVWTAR